LVIVVLSNTPSKYFMKTFRLQYAQRLLNAGIERGHNPDLGHAKEWLRRTEKALADAKKDNDFIYHERIPEEKALTPIGKAAGWIINFCCS